MKMVDWFTSKGSPQDCQPVAVEQASPAAHSMEKAVSVSGKPATSVSTIWPSSTVSVELVATRNHHEYGVNRVVNLAHEIFLYLHTYQPEYMWKHFDAPQE